MQKIVIAFRSLLLRLFHPFNIKASGFQNIPLRSEIRSRRKGIIILQNGVSVMSNITLSVVEGELSIGSRTAFNKGCQIACRKQITIGNNCQFGPNVVIYDHDHCFDYNGIINNKYSTEAIKIDDNCWICANVTILKGTHIGESSVIGAGAVVKGEIPPHSLVLKKNEYAIKPITR